MTGAAGQAGKKRSGRLLLGCLLLLAGFFFWRSAFLRAEALNVFENRAVLRDLKEAPEAGTYPTMQAVEQAAALPAGFTLWSQADAQTLQNPLTARQAKAAALFVKGDSRLALPVSQRLSPEDSRGCLIDRETALSLFGSANARDGQVEYAGKRYTVRDVFVSPGASIVLNAPPDRVMENMSMDHARESQAFLLRHHLSAAFEMKQAWYGQAGGLFCIFTACPLAAAGLWRLWRAGRRQRAYPFRWALLTGALLGAFTLLLLFLLGVLPAEWTPSRWSDFSFWQSQASLWRQRFLEIGAMQKYRPDLLLGQMLGQTALSACAGFLAFLFVPFCFPGGKKRKPG